MNIQQVKTLVTVVDAGSFSEAARVLGVSQPAVSMQIQTLESDIGEALLDRRYRRVDLTEAGASFLPHARRMLAEADQARAEIAALSGEVGGTLRLVLSTTPGDYIVPRLLGAFIAEYPRVEVNLSVTSTAGVIEEVEAYRADVGMAGAKVRGAKVDYEELGRDELVAIAGPDNPLATAGTVTLAQLAQQPWVQRLADSGTQQVLKAAFAQHGVDVDSLNAIVKLGTGEAVVNAVEGGLGVAVVSRFVAQRAISAGAVVELPVRGFPIERPFYLVTPRRTLSRAAAAFVTYLRAELSGGAAR